MSWTQEKLLNEALGLIDQINEETDPAEQKKMDGCFRAVQEVLIVLNKPISRRHQTE